MTKLLIIHAVISGVIFITTILSMLTIANKIKNEMKWHYKQYVESFHTPWFETAFVVLIMFVLCYVPFLRWVILYVVLTKLDYMKNNIKCKMYQKLVSLEFGV